MIVVRDGLEPPFPVIARYCGDLDDVGVTSSGDTVLAEFDGDGRQEGPGFAGRYSFIEPQSASGVERQDGLASDRQPTKRPNNAGRHLKHVGTNETRKLSYRKEDRAMRSIYGCPGKFREF